jgi:hypothetical protein
MSLSQSPLGTQALNKVLIVCRTKYQETWVALNWKMTLPTSETHPSFPLWRLGYTPQQVYDAFFPIEFRFLCNPQRPAVCGRFGPESERLWRFEFVVAHDEDDLEMASPAKIDEVVVPYITHPGKLYGYVGVLSTHWACHELSCQLQGIGRCEVPSRLHRSASLSTIPLLRTEL